MTVRLMAPFSMKCTTCGEYIYRGRKFNARKETTDEKYLNIAIYRFYIRCTRCSSELTFKTDPANMDYTCEKGAKRNFEVWRKGEGEGVNPLETEDERLDRLEAQRAEAGGAMEELEMKVHDAKQEMAIADALDEIRTRNARISRAEGREAEPDALEAADRKRREIEDEKRRIEEEDAETARKAFARAAGDIEIEDEESTLMTGLESGGSGSTSSGSSMYGDLIAAQVGDGIIPTPHSSFEHSRGGDMAPPPRPASTSQQPPQQPPAPEFKKVVKKKKDFSAALGIKKKPALV